jgi:hypothetical protein
MTSPIYGSDAMRPLRSSTGVWHGGWPLPTVADDDDDSAIRPDLSSAVASEDKEKPRGLFFGFS